MQWLAKKFQNKLAVKVVVLMVLAGTVFSIAASAVQIYVSYQQNLKEVVDEIDIVDQTFRSSFENALSDSNFQQVEVLLNGVAANANIGYLLLVSPAGGYWIRGIENTDDMIVKTFELANIKDEITGKIGEFTVGVTLDHVNERAWSQFIIIFISNLVKSTISSIVMLILFNRLVSVHLRQIAIHVAENSWMSAQNLLSLKRRTSASFDDLDAIVKAINEVKENYIASYNRLENEVSMRCASERKLEIQTLELKQSSLQLQRVNQEQAEFTYAISHDLKSPTNTISMINDELIEAYSDQLGEDGRDLLGMSQKTIVRMAEMIEYVLHYSTAINKEMQLEAIVLNKLVENVEHDLQDEIQKSGAVITIGELPTIVGDSTQIRLLFQNVISNAIKFRSPGQSPEVDIQVCEDCGPNEVKISIRDNGIGIAQEDRLSVFSLFNKLHAHDVYPGSGIGLALCHRIATNHHGAIEFREHSSNDTVVDITLAA